MIMNITRSAIWHKHRLQEAEVEGRWVTQVAASEFHAAGTIVSEPAPGEPDDLTFTAPNGKRYWDVPSGVHWTPLAA